MGAKHSKKARLPPLQGEQRNAAGSDESQPPQHRDPAAPPLPPRLNLDLDRAYISSVESQKVLLAAIARADLRSVRSCLDDHKAALNRFSLWEPALRQALEQRQLSCVVSIKEGLSRSHWWYVVLDCVRTGTMTHCDVQPLLQCEDIDLDERVHLAVLLGETDYVVHAATSESRSRLTPDDWSSVLWLTYRKGDVYLACHLQQHVRLTVDEDLLFAACTAGDTDFVTQAVTGHTDTDAAVDWDNIMWAACSMGHGDLITAITRHQQMEDTDGELVLACAAGDLLAMQRRLTDIRDVVTWYRYLSVACLAGHAHVCDVLMELTRQARWDVGEVVRRMKYYGQWVHYEYNKTINTSTIDFIETKLGEVYSPDLTRLHEYCYKGESGYIHQDTTCHPNVLVHVNTIGYHGYSPLHITVLGHDDKVEKIIEDYTQIMPSFSDEHSKEKLNKPSPASLDRITERVEIVQYLLQHGAMVDCKDKQNRTALHLAAISGGLDVFPMLLDAGASVDAKDAIGMSPIAYSSQKGHHRIVEYLITRKCNVTITNIYNQTPLHHASQHNHVQCVELLAVHPDLINHQDCDGISALSLACSAGHSQVVDVLLQNKADPEIPDKDGQGAVHKAAMAGWGEVLDKLISSKVNLNLQDNTGSTALHLAITSRRWEVARRLLEAGSKTDLKDNLGNTPCHNIIMWDPAKFNCESTNILYRHFTQVKNNCGDTVLMQATNILDIPMMTFLIDRGADITTIDNMGRGLIHNVVTSQYHGMQLRKLNNIEECKKELKTYGLYSKINASFDNDDEIEFAVPFSNIQEGIENVPQEVLSSAFNVSVMRFLLSQKLNVNAVDTNGHNALHLAAQTGNLMATIYLLEHGADFTAKDKFGFTPIMFALSHDAVFKVLWEKSLPKMTENHFNLLRLLAHWCSNDGVKEKCESHLTSITDLSDQPQDFVQPQWKCDRDFTKWQNQSMEMEITTVDEFLPIWISTLQKLTYVNHQKIIQTLRCLIEEVLKRVSERDPLMACKFRLSGSEREGAKVIATNEIDSLCVLLAITFDKFITPDEAAHHVLKEFVQLKCKEEYKVELQRVLDSNGCLSRSKLFQNYGAVLSEVLADPDLWAKYPNLQRVSKMDITGSIATITPLMVRWNDEVYQNLEVSIDMVPALDISGWRPSWANKHPLLDLVTILIVPKWKTTAVEDDTLLEVGVSHWGECFERMPTSMLQGYRLAKVTKELCPQISNWDWLHISDLISSYMLKMTIISLYAASLDDQPPPTHSDLHWAREIYQKMESSFRDQKLRSFFIPEYNLLYDDKFVTYKEAAIAYCQLCLKLLVPETASHMRKAYMGINEDASS